MAFLIIPMGYFASNSFPVRFKYSRSNSAARGGFRSDRAQGSFHPRFRDVHADAREM